MENPATWNALTKDLAQWIEDWDFSMQNGVCGLSLPRFLNDRLIEKCYVLEGITLPDDEELE